ncbi:MAG: twin-arginine translocation signal domain-containing protein, partial [Devosiaceae bacterium]|nr:twin-arginine translocation signal domain-containing protein [Devosiaceae bacterium MH13]
MDDYSTHPEEEAVSATVTEDAQPDGGRRAFMKGASLAALTAAMGVGIPFGRYLPEGYSPIGLAHAQGVDLEAIA